MNREEKVAFVICTNSELWFEECKKYIDRLNVPKGIEVEMVPIFDATGMANGYNRAMKMCDAKYKIYIHHDTFIINENLIENILDIFHSDSRIGIIGMIGANDIKNDSVSVGNWEYGKVFACNGGSEVCCDFGEIKEDYCPVDCVDGMFIATQYDIEWREDLFPNWHFYDRSICMEYRRKGYISVVPRQEVPWSIHDCGVNSLIGWKNGLEKFVSEYQEYFSEGCLERSITALSDETIRVSVERLANSIESLINNKCMEEAQVALRSFRELGVLPNKKLMFMLEIMELYKTGKTRFLFQEDDTVDRMMENYTKAKFILRRVIYGIDITEEEAIFAKAFSEEEQESILNHNLQASIESAEKLNAKKQGIFPCYFFLTFAL